MFTDRIKLVLPALLFILGIVLIGYFVNRDESLTLMLTYTGLFVVYILYYLWVKDEFGYKFGIGLAFLTRIILVFSLPILSDDYFRFIWDGLISANGSNPYLSLPAEVVSSAQLSMDLELYQNLNSKEFYTVYPPVCQYIFQLAANLFPTGLVSQVIFLKSTILLAEFGSIFMLSRIVKFMGLDKKATLLYAINPLVIIELTGNIHFEALMIFFVLTAIYFLITKRYAISSVALALGIATKLLPILFIPFLIKRIGWLKTIVYSLTAFSIVTFFFAPYFSPELVENITSSVGLYFRHFEFNASLYSIAEIFLGSTLMTAGLIIPLSTGVMLVVFWLLDRNKSILGWAEVIQWTLFFYLTFASTVHPWYMVFLIALNVITGYRFAVVWSLVIFFTYLTYSQIPYEQNYLVIIIEYLVLFCAVYVDLVNKRKGFKKGAKWRANIKLNRIKGLLEPTDRILEVGSGNCAVTKLLREKGHYVVALDVKNLSFFQDVKPVIYDGENMPFEDKRFDVVQLLTMLHHTQNPEQILSESVRVARRLIVIEDVYKNTLQKKLTFLVDSIVNLEFTGHPHTNKAEEGWEQLFKKLQLKVSFKEKKRFLLFFSQVTYLLETEKESRQ